MTSIIAWYYNYWLQQISCTVVRRNVQDKFKPQVVLTSVGDLTT